MALKSLKLFNKYLDLIPDTKIISEKQIESTKRFKIYNDKPKIDNSQNNKQSIQCLSNPFTAKSNKMAHITITNTIKNNNNFKTIKNNNISESKINDKNIDDYINYDNDININNNNEKQFLNNDKFNKFNDTIKIKKSTISQQPIITTKLTTNKQEQEQEQELNIDNINNNNNIQNQYHNQHIINNTNTINNKLLDKLRDIESILAQQIAILQNFIDSINTQNNKTSKKIKLIRDEYGRIIDAIITNELNSDSIKNTP